MNLISVFHFTGVVAAFLGIEVFFSSGVVGLDGLYEPDILMARILIYVTIAYCFNKFVTSNREDICNLVNNKDFGKLRTLIFGKKRR